MEVASPLLLRAGRYCVNLHCVAGKPVLRGAAIVAAASVAHIAAAPLISRALIASRASRPGTFYIAIMLIKKWVTLCDALHAEARRARDELRARATRGGGLQARAEPGGRQWRPSREPTTPTACTAARRPTRSSDTTATIRSRVAAAPTGLTAATASTPSSTAGFGQPRDRSRFRRHRRGRHLCQHRERLRLIV